MRLYFVMDIKGGRVVRAYRGERERYGPITEHSVVVKSDDPLDVIKTVRPRYAYVADLDAIEGRGSGFDVETLAEGLDELIFDGGFRCVEGIRRGKFVPVLGSETINVKELDEDLDCYVSLDVYGGRLIGASTGIGVGEAVEHLNTIRVLGVILIQIDRVGSLDPDFGLLEEVLSLSDNPVLFGGGIRGMEDLLRLKEMGCKGALVSTSVHRGAIGLEVVRRGKI